MLSIGIFGGTFDPVHHAHIQVALITLQTLQLDEVRLLPCRQSPTRIAPLATGEHRLAMLQRAITDYPGLAIDDRELERPGPSYSVDTLQAVRNESPQAGLYFIVGVDAFNGLLSWHKWSELLDLAHIVVVGRPGEKLVSEGELAELLAQRQTTKKPTTRAGCIITGLQCELPHAASKVRELIKAGKSAGALLNESVYHYIQEHGLYQ